MNSALKNVYDERLHYLEEYRALAEAAMGALSLALSSPSLDQAACAEILAVWRRRLDSLHLSRLSALEASTGVTQPRQPAPPPLPLPASE